MAQTVYGNDVAYDGGKFQIGVTYECTNSAIKAKPFIKMKKGFSHAHNLTLWYITQTTGVSREAKIPYTSLDYYDPSGNYYPWGDKNDLTIYDVSVTFYAHANASGNTNVSGNSALTIKATVDPAPPSPVHVEIPNGQGGDSHLSIYVATVNASNYKQVKMLQFFRMDESRTSGGSWAQIGATQRFSPALKAPIYYPPNQALHIFDTSVTPSGKYKYRCTTTGTNNETASTDSDWYCTSPPPPTDVTHARVDDSRNRIYFNRDRRDVVLGKINGYVVQCNMRDPRDSNFEDGWFWISNLANYDKGRNQKSGWLTHDYDDIAIDHLGCARDGRYSYRIATANNFRVGDYNSQKQYSNWVELGGTETTYNTPNKPKGITGVADFSDDEIKIKLWIACPVLRDNSTADVLFLQRRKNPKSKWKDVPSSDSKMIPLSSKWSDEGLEYKQINGQWVYEYEDLDVDDLVGALGTEVQYQAAFGCTKTNQYGNPVLNNGKSEWSDPCNVALIAQPNPPNLTLPIKNSLVANDTGTVRLVWAHSPVDGTPQEDAMVQYKTSDSDPWQSVVITDKKESYVDIPLGEFSVNSTVTWRVATKGLHKDFSDWSESNFKIVAKPTISFIGLTENVNITHQLPLTISWDYQDQSGTMDSLELEVYQDNDLLKKVKIDPQEEEYTISDVFFYDEVQYALKIKAISTTRFSAEATTIVEMRYSDIKFLRGFSVVASFDESTGYSIVNVEKLLPDENGGINDEETEDEIFSTAKIKHFYLYRLYNGERTFIAEEDIDIANYDSITTFSYIDKTEPINRDFDYRLIQVSEGNETGISKNNIYMFETIWWYIYFGADNIIKTRWNPSSSVTLGRPERQEVRYSGRKYPVVYDSLAREETFSYDFILLRETQYYEDSEDGPYQVIQKFKDLMATGGVGFWKSFEGDVYDAKFDFSYSSDYKEGVKMWNCNLNVGRIEGDE